MCPQCCLFCFILVAIPSSSQVVWSSCLEVFLKGSPTADRWSTIIGLMMLPSKKVKSVGGVDRFRASLPILESLDVDAPSRLKGPGYTLKCWRAVVVGLWWLEQIHWVRVRSASLMILRGDSASSIIFTICVPKISCLAAEPCGQPESQCSTSSSSLVSQRLQ